MGDIDRSEVFTAFVGTLELLEPDGRKRVSGFVVNKFRAISRCCGPGSNT